MAKWPPEKDDGKGMPYMPEPSEHAPETPTTMWLKRYKKALQYLMDRANPSDIVEVQKILRGTE